MWNLPKSEIKPLSSALAEWFLSTAPPGKSQNHIILYWEETLQSKLLLSPGIPSTMSWSKWSFSLRPTPNSLHYLALTWNLPKTVIKGRLLIGHFCFPESSFVCFFHRKFLCMLWWILHTYNFYPLIIVLLSGRFFVIICGEIFEKLEWQFKIS